MFFRNFYKSLAAVLVGNAIYFLLLWPVLPNIAQHHGLLWRKINGVSIGVPRIDLGLVIDFWVCVVVYGVIEFLLKRRAQRSELRK